jgi:hypothetical protein
MMATLVETVDDGDPTTMMMDILRKHMVVTVSAM